MTKNEDLTRRQIRYLCFRLQTEIEGGNKATREETGLMSFVDRIKEHMEQQEDFGGWNMFAKTWDVDEKSPLVVVKRTSSIYSDWNKILKEEAKELPKEKKFLTNKLSEKVQEAKKKQQAAPEEIPPQEEVPVPAETKQVKNDLQEEVQENRKQSKKVSFWDRLK
ncbi:MAG: hypothetical protein PHE48_04275 [Candidatus Daviesbacteria bacterium]|nr:hypothetical protein [Candidatus Daviesbacteria bacterium]